MNPLPLPRCAAAYLRVSTDEQLELSPDSQLAEIQKYAQREGIRLLPEHVYIDPGISGKRAERRPQFLKMIAAAKEKDCPFSVILLWKYSRFARNQEESIFYKSILRSKCGVEVISVTEPLAAGPFGSLIERIIEWMDEFYSIRLSQEVKRSMTVNAERGKLQCTPAFGYRAERGRLEPVEGEAACVRLIFARFLGGNGPFSIAKELNALGIRTHRGNPFEGRTVSYILQNPVYIGLLRWTPSGRAGRKGGNDATILAHGSHVPLVSEGVWWAAQKRLADSRRRSPSGARSSAPQKAWPSGLVRCSVCGARLVFTKPHYYRCGGYVRGRCAVSQHILAETLEEGILSRLRQDGEDAARLSVTLVASQPEAGEQRALLRNALRSVQSKEARLQEAYLNEVLSLEEFGAARQSLAQQQFALEEQLSQLAEPAQDAVSTEALLSEAQRAEQTLRRSSASPEALHRAAGAVVEQCILDREGGTLKVIYRFTL